MADQSALVSLFGKRSEPASTNPQAAQAAQAAQATPAKKIGGFKLGGLVSPPEAKPTPEPVVEPEPVESVEPLRAPEPSALGLTQMFSGFKDEVPAQQVSSPDRRLPDEVSPQMRQFIDLMDGVYQISNEPDLVGNVIRSIMIELKSNPQYINTDPLKSLVAPDDVRMWIRLMRDSMGLAKIKKQETKAKTASRKSSKTADVDMLADLQALGLTFDD